jgi:acylphosphatase
MSRAIIQVVITGRVQNVGYRAWVQEQAAACELEGWVRNRKDGSVEALFAGNAKAVADMVALCRHGPPSARVRDLVSESGSEKHLDLRRPGERFSVLPAA